MRRKAIDLYMTQLCEQAREVTDETRSRMKSIPWSAIAEMRTYLVHVYDSLNPNIMWDTIITDLDPLRKACLACIDEIESGKYHPTYMSRTKEHRDNDASADRADK
jgi:uncharacterized protein with HEPN domain